MYLNSKIMLCCPSQNQTHCFTCIIQVSCTLSHRMRKSCLEAHMDTHNSTASLRECKAHTRMHQLHSSCNPIPIKHTLKQSATPIVHVDLFSIVGQLLVHVSAQTNVFQLQYFEEKANSSLSILLLTN